MISKKSDEAKEGDVPKRFPLAFWCRIKKDDFKELMKIDSLTIIIFIQNGILSEIYLGVWKIFKKKLYSIMWTRLGQW